ncbi:hypothetical protein [Saccharopolyspora spinosa]|uniref:hypothetical protein n=1 Tax=Saccharopolyspora spinosa TaxID=60894 RepID=UPI0011D2C1A3|nr:hypothetical protein [Saccharopolyspora spinosa]
MSRPVPLPVIARHRELPMRGIRTADSVLLVADPRQDMLLVDPLPAVDEALAQQHTTVWGGEPA